MMTLAGLKERIDEAAADPVVSDNHVRIQIGEGEFIWVDFVMIDKDIATLGLATSFRDHPAHVRLEGLQSAADLSISEGLPLDGNVRIRIYPGQSSWIEDALIDNDTFLIIAGGVLPSIYQYPELYK